MGNNTDGTPKPKSGWGTSLKIKRKQLRETQTEFGKRFGVGAVAVSLWEQGKRDLPGEVTWWLTKNPILRDEWGYPRELGPCNGKCLNHPHLDRNGEVTNG